MPPRFFIEELPSNGCLSHRRVGGFTLIELLTVVAIIGILASISFGVIRGINERAAVATAKAELAMLAKALEDYKQYYGDYPLVAEDNADDSGKLLYWALNGAMGPKGKVYIMTKDAGGAKKGAGKSFVDNNRLTSRLPSEANTGNVTVTTTDSKSNYYIDPWGRAYRYRYNPGASWKGNGYILFSVGAKTERGKDDLGNDRIKAGEIVTSDKAGDNIYANQY